MGQSSSLKLRRQQQLAEWITNIFFNARRFHWTQQFILDAINKEIYSSDQWTKLPESWRGELRGRIRCEFDRIMREELVHSYMCVDGVRRPQGEYKMPSCNSPKSLIDTTCKFVWKSNTSKLY